MIDRAQKTILAVLIAVGIALGAACYVKDRQAAEAQWIGSYPMANANIVYEIPRFPGSGGAR